MIKQASQLKRRRRTKQQIEQLENQIIEVLAEDHPQSVRHVFYRMTDPRLPEPVEKTDAGYNQVQSRVLLLRRAGRIPYGWITDATRMGWHTNTYSSPADFILSHAHAYRADLWRESEWHVEVWAESRSIAGVINAVCRELAVSLYPCGGFASVSLAHEAAQDINDVTQATGRTPLIYFIGDYDPAGVLIDQSLEKELRAHVRGPLLFERLAINSDQIQDLGLPAKPRKKGDKRALHITETVEAEAMPANIMRDLIRDHIEVMLPERALEVARIAEQSERQHLIEMANLFEGQQHDGR
jgi:hypothetical protein